jgi:ferredoxin
MGRQYRITVQETGNSFSCAEDEAILKAMFHAGRGPLTNGCCGGGCGICRMQIVSGEWQAFKPMSTAHVSEDEVKQGVALLCCIQPRSDMVIAGL